MLEDVVPRMLCDGDLRHGTPVGEDVMPPEASMVEVVTAAWHRLIGMDLEAAGLRSDVKPDAGIDGGEVVCLILVDIDAGALVGVG